LLRRPEARRNTRATSASASPGRDLADGFSSPA
jgi:hypothetical protein